MKKTDKKIAESMESAGAQAREVVVRPEEKEMIDRYMAAMENIGIAKFVFAAPSPSDADRFLVSIKGVSMREALVGATNIIENTVAASLKTHPDWPVEQRAAMLQIVADIKSAVERWYRTGTSPTVPAARA